MSFGVQAIACGSDCISGVCHPSQASQDNSLKAWVLLADCVALLRCARRPDFRWMTCSFARESCCVARDSWKVLWSSNEGGEGGAQ